MANSVAGVSCCFLGRTLTMILGLGLLSEGSAGESHSIEPYGIELKPNGCIRGCIKSIDLISCGSLASPLLYVMSYDEYGNNRAEVYSFKNGTGTQYTSRTLLRKRDNPAGIGRTVAIDRNHVCYLSATFNSYISNCKRQPAEYPAYIPFNPTKNYPILQSQSCKRLSPAFVLSILTAKPEAPPTYSIGQLIYTGKFKGITTIDLATENNSNGNVSAFVWSMEIGGCTNVGIYSFPPSKSLEEASVRPFQNIPVSSNPDVTSLKTRDEAYLLIAQNKPKCERSNSCGWSREEGHCDGDDSDKPRNVLDIWGQTPGELFSFKQRIHLRDIQSTSAITTEKSLGCFVIVASSEKSSSGFCETSEESRKDTAVHMFCYDASKHKFKLLKKVEMPDVTQASIQKCEPDGGVLLYVLAKKNLRIFKVEDSALTLHLEHQMDLKCHMKRMDFGSFLYRGESYNQMFLTSECGGATVYNIACGAKYHHIANLKPQNEELEGEHGPEIN